MPYVVSPFQCSFVPGRSTIDNVVILQEMLHSMNSMKGRKGYMILKLDLEKAYDCLEWDVMKNTLTDLVVPPSLVELIYTCISSSSMARVVAREAASRLQGG